jgi:hypothetical protein
MMAMECRRGSGVLFPSAIYGLLALVVCNSTVPASSALLKPLLACCSMLPACLLPAPSLLCLDNRCRHNSCSSFVAA